MGLLPELVLIFPPIPAEISAEIHMNWPADSAQGERPFSGDRPGTASWVTDGYISVGFDGRDVEETSSLKSFVHHTMNHTGIAPHSLV